MKPRFVNVQLASQFWIDYGSFRTAKTTMMALRASNNLYDIVSDDVRRITRFAPEEISRRKRLGLSVAAVMKPKAHSYKKELRILPHGNYSYVFGSDPSTFPRYCFEGANFGSLPPVSVYDDSLLLLAQAKIQHKFFEKLKNSELDLAIAVAERAKTKVMIARKAALLLNLKRWIKEFWRRVRERSIRRHESIAVSLSNLWLEFQYGWRQLAQDIFGIATFTRQAAGDLVVKVRSKVADIAGGSDLDTSTGLRRSWDYTSTVTSEMKVKLTLAGDPVLDLTRLMSLNPAAIAWEVLPFSFVFDWILNISRYLSELQTYVMFSLIPSQMYVNHTIRNSVVGSYPAQVTKGTFQSYNLATTARFKNERVFKNRTIPVALPVPRFPTLKSPLSLSHALTTLSLITQILGGRFAGKNSGYFLGRDARFQ